MQKHTPHSYQIRVLGRLDDSWSTWFENFSITYPDEQTTLLSGQVRDQSQLHAILIKIRDLNLTLVSVNSDHDLQVEE
jgi:hypothetical protein